MSAAGLVSLSGLFLLLAGLLGYALWQMLDFYIELLIISDLRFGSLPASQIRPTLLQPMSAAPDPITRACCGSGRQSFDDGFDIPPFHGSRHSRGEQDMEMAETPHAVRAQDA